MRVQTNKKPLPRTWATHPAAQGVLLEKDIGTGFGRLRAKLLVFKNRSALKNFWRSGVGSKLHGQVQGAVNGLYEEVIQVQPRGSKKPDTSCLRVDPRYFCVIGLTRGFLSMEIISHEAVHAAFAFTKRKTRSPWDCHARDFDEEAIAYPAGRIAAAINRTLHAAKLYK